MVRPSSTTSLFALAFILNSHAPLRAQAAASWSGCQPDNLSTYNCASYYTGSVTLTSELKSPKGTESRSIAATVAAGRTTCRVKVGTEPAFEGAGMLAVEHETTANAGQYTIKVWCPSSPGARPTRDDAPVIDSYERQATNYGVLEGKDVHEHPEADAANGVTGSETTSWALHR